MDVEIGREEDEESVPGDADPIELEEEPASLTGIAGALEDLRSVLHPEIDLRANQEWAKDEATRLRKRLSLSWESRVIGAIETATQRLVTADRHTPQEGR